MKVFWLSNADDLLVCPTHEHFAIHTVLDIASLQLLPFSQSWLLTDLWYQLISASAKIYCNMGMMHNYAPEDSIEEGCVIDFPQENIWWEKKAIALIKAWTVNLLKLLAFVWVHVANSIRNETTDYLFGLHEEWLTSMVSSLFCLLYLTCKLLKCSTRSDAKNVTSLPWKFTVSFQTDCQWFVRNSLNLTLMKCD